MSLDQGHVVGLLATSVLAGIATVGEAAYVFRDTSGMARRCWHIGFLGFAGGAILAAGIFAFLWAGADQGIYEFEGAKPSILLLGVMTLASLQLVRIEMIPRGNIPGLEGVTQTVESPYGKIKRMFRSLLFRHLVEHMTHDEILRSLLCKALPEVYNLQDAEREFRGILQGMKANKRRPVRDYFEDTLASEGFSDKQKCEALFGYLAVHYPKLSAHLAGRRASAIVDKDAFR